MCEYCGCQSIEAIAELTSEHDVVRELTGLVAAAATAGELARARDIARVLEVVLGPHTAVEERGLFRAMAREYPEHVARLEAEHRTVEAALAELDDPRPRDGWGARVADAMRLLERHAFTEQDGLFPAALATLDPADWAAVDAVRAEVGSGLSSVAQ